MSQIFLAGLCGLIAGVIAAVAAVALFFAWKLKRNDSITLTCGPRPEFYKEVKIMEYSSRPQGLYLRFHNCGAKPIEMAHFKVQGFKQGKLWAELEETVYCETQPGMEQETILQLRDSRDCGKQLDLSDCRVEIQFLYGFVRSTKAG